MLKALTKKYVSMFFGKVGVYCPEGGLQIVPQFL